MTAPTPAPIEFWFDFISPFAFLASRQIEALAARHGRTVAWRPLLLGVTVLKVMGLKPLMDTPLKRDYTVRDLQRQARRLGTAFGRPMAAAPMNPLPAARAMAWLVEHRPDAAPAFGEAVMQAYWADGQAMDNTAALHRLLQQVGVDDPLDPALQGDAPATLLRASVAEALERGLFGSPFFVVDGEPFWGLDKLAEVELWLITGGW